MNLLHFAFLSVTLYLTSICSVLGQNCEKQTRLSGIIDYTYRSNNYYSPITKCWFIGVPQDSYVRLDLSQLNLDNIPCSHAYVNISVAEVLENYTYCSHDKYRKPITALNDVSITFYFDSRGGYRNTVSLRLNYTTENLICTQKKHFRCSPNECIHQYQVCNGVKDCANGVDEVGCEKGIEAVKGVNISRENVVSWLKRQRSTSSGWGKNTHRAITALYLAKAASFSGDNLEEELMVKQLELQTAVALLRNSTDPVSVSELSMFINALTVTCHNPRNFYGHDLLQILGTRMSTILTSPSPSAYLTLCSSISDRKHFLRFISESGFKSLLKIIHKHSKYPFHLDVQAVAVMALTCVKNKANRFKTAPSPEISYDMTIKKFISGQLPDGSFGNVYTTALVTQALISNGEENNKKWNVESTARYLMEQLNSSSIDFLSAYLALPVLSGRSLLDITIVNCSNVTRKQGEDDEISDVTNKLGGKMRIQYSLYVGDQKDVIHTMFLRMPENSTAYDVMRVAQVADSKYKFHQRDVSGQMYVYEIAGITNDPEAGKFWLLYTENPEVNGTTTHHTESPDKFILGDDEHLIMWYRTAHI